jgi:flagellin-specific chaperone FliS
MEEIIRTQRVTLDEHIRQERAKNWLGLYDTIVQDESATTSFPSMPRILDFTA